MIGFLLMAILSFTQIAIKTTLVAMSGRKRFQEVTIIPMKVQEEELGRKLV